MNNSFLFPVDYQVAWFHLKMHRNSVFFLGVFFWCFGFHYLIKLSVFSLAFSQLLPQNIASVLALRAIVLASYSGVIFHWHATPWLTLGSTVGFYFIRWQILSGRSVSLRLCLYFPMPFNIQASSWGEWGGEVDMCVRVAQICLATQEVQNQTVQKSSFTITINQLYLELLQHWPQLAPEEQAASTT